VGVGRVERVLAERVDVGVSSLANEATPGGRSGVGVGVRFEFVEANLALADAVGRRATRVWVRSWPGFLAARANDYRFCRRFGAAGYPSELPDYRPTIPESRSRSDSPPPSLVVGVATVLVVVVDPADDLEAEVFVEAERPGVGRAGVAGD